MGGLRESCENAYDWKTAGMGVNLPVTVARRVLVVDTGAEASVGDTLELVPVNSRATFCSLAFWQTFERISAALSISLAFPFRRRYNRPSHLALIP